MSRYALVFPGQGSQKRGMGADLYEGSPASRAVFDTADATSSRDLAGICFHGTDEELKRTVNTQPALYTVSCAILSALRERIDLAPACVAGHSVGEYAAIVASGAIAFEDGLRLVMRRAELMDSAARRTPGAMAAVLGLGREAVQAVCLSASASGVAVIANYNAPGQIVIAGDSAGVEAAVRLAKEAGARRVLPLAVSGGFHSPLMGEAGEALAQELSRTVFLDAILPVVTNVNAEPTSVASRFAPLLVQQVYSSVMWEQSVERMVALGVELFVEVGPGEVLCGLIRRIAPGVEVVSARDLPTLTLSVDAIARAAA